MKPARTKAILPSIIFSSHDFNTFANPLAKLVPGVLIGSAKRQLGL